ncbi:MAG: hypothetical protein H6Q17_2163 [Bacteroidetes bacterium]|jgi:hypothetical protein|nr:hypothetical protein [Bacteroidota bacterium]
MKIIDVPYTSRLDSASIEVASDILEEEGSAGSIESVNWPLRYPYKPLTSFYIARSEDAIFIKYAVNGNVLCAVYSKDQDPVWKDSCVEFFCKRADQEGYMNFEFNCIGACYSAKHVTRQESTKRTPEELNQILRFPSIGTKAFQEMEGNFEWELTVAIPFALLGIDSHHLPEKILGNFYKCADDTAFQHYLSWNPILTPNPDFHRPEFFGELRFV